MEVFYGEILKQIRVTVILADYVLFWIYTLVFEHSFYILLSISKLCHDRIGLKADLLIEKTAVSLESKNNYELFQMWLSIHSLCWLDLGRLKVSEYAKLCAKLLLEIHIPLRSSKSGTWTLMATCFWKLASI